MRRTPCHPRSLAAQRPHALLRVLAVVLWVLASPTHAASSANVMEAMEVDPSETMEQLARQREALAGDLEQLERTLAVLHQGNGSPWSSSDPRLAALVQDSVHIRQQMLAVAQRELALLQRQMAPPQDNILAGASPVEPAGTVAGAVPSAPENARPNTPASAPGSADPDAQSAAVKRLKGLIASYYSDLQKLAETMPSTEEMAARESALKASRGLKSIPIDAEKLLLDGEEGGAALRLMSERLADPAIAESRRDMAPICSIRTRLFGDLIASDNRSLLPVGKNQYVARVRVRAGATSLRVRDDEWQLRRANDANAADFLVTFLAEPGTAAQMHLVPVVDLREAAGDHLPAWLPAELKLAPRD